MKKLTPSQQHTSAPLAITNGLTNAQPQDGDTPHSLRKSNSQENLEQSMQQLDEKMKRVRFIVFIYKLVRSEVFEYFQHSLESEIITH